MTANSRTTPAEPPAAPAGGGTVARRGDLVVIHLHHRDYRQDYKAVERDDYRAGQVTSVTRGGQVRRYRPAGQFTVPDRPLPAGFEQAWVISAARGDVPAALAAAACHCEQHGEACPRPYGSLDEVLTALRPCLHGTPGHERLADAARAWHAAREAAVPLLTTAAGTDRGDFPGVFATYEQAVADANNAYRQAHTQAAGKGNGDA